MAILGANPKSIDEVNSYVGSICRQVLNVRIQLQSNGIAFMNNTDLKVAPYNLTVAEENLVKGALNDINTALQGMPLTNIRQLVGLF